MSLKETLIIGLTNEHQFTVSEVTEDDKNYLLVNDSEEKPGIVIDNDGDFFVLDQNKTKTKDIHLSTLRIDINSNTASALVKDGEEEKYVDDIVLRGYGRLPNQKAELNNFLISLFPKIR